MHEMPLFIAECCLMSRFIAFRFIFILILMSLDHQGRSKNQNLFNTKKINQILLYLKTKYQIDLIIGNNRGPSILASYSFFWFGTDRN